MCRALLLSAFLAVWAAALQLPASGQTFSGNPQFLVQQVSDVPHLHTVDLVDLNGDGPLDIVVSSHNGFTGWYEAGQAGFHRLTDMVGRPFDVDGDGDLDIAEPNNWAPNDGQMNFGPLVSTPGVDCLNDWGGADFNGDGYGDFVFYNGCTNELRGLFSTGPGTFDPEFFVAATSSNLQSFRSLDLDLDGDMDFLVLVSGEQRLAAYLNDGSGGFSEQTALQAQSGNLDRFVLTDIDGNGLLDLLQHQLLNWNPGWAPGNGDGTFGDVLPVGTGDWSSEVQAADMDADGDVDVVSRHSQLVWYANEDGLGAFGSPRPIGPIQDQGMVVADLYSDGFADIVLYDTRTSSIELISTQGVDAFVNFPLTGSEIGQPREILTADFDMDGKDEIALGANWRELWYLDPMDGRPNRPVEMNYGLNSLALGDFSGDDIPDLAGVSGNILGTYENYDGAGYFGPLLEHARFDWPLGVQRVVSGDFDSDGAEDLVISKWDQTNQTQSLVHFARDPASGLFREGASSPYFEGSLDDLQATDLDGDGDPDVLAIDRRNNSIVWFLNTQGSFGPPEFVQEHACVDSVDDGDFDGDGDLDVIAISCGHLVWYENEFGAGSWTQHTALEGTGCFQSLVAEDLTGDGYPDLLVGDHCQSEVYLHINDGAGSILVSELAVSGIAWPRDLELGDLDGDGDQDLVVASTNSDQVAWVENTGAGSAGGLMTLDVCDSSGCLELSFGYAAGASDGFDADFDQLAPPAPPGGVLDGRFVLGGEAFLKDVRAPNQDEVTWNVDFSGTGVMTLRWDPGAFPTGGVWRLKDSLTGDIVNLDMRGQNTFEDALGIGLYRIAFSAAVVQPYNFVEGWNMFSVPVHVTGSAEDNFGDAMANSWFGFEGTYARPGSEELVCGEGYWIRFATAVSTELVGLPCDTVTLDLVEGWNMIGGPFCSVAYSAIGDEGGILLDGTLFDFQGGYRQANTVEPGVGYWIRSTSAGTVLLDCGAASKAPAPDLVARTLEGFSRLLVSDANGGSQTLYWGGELPAGTHPLAYTVPPQAAAGGFEARFESGRYLSNRAGETLLIDGALLPLEVTAEADLTLVAKDESGRVIERISLRAGVPALLTSGAIKSLTLGEAELPGQFTLEPAYPNPFNPVTTLQYVLPDASSVSLDVFDALGRRVAVLIDRQPMAAGRHSVRFDAGGLATGLYIARITAGEHSAVQHLVLTK